jgi:hypothetical protein
MPVLSIVRHGSANMSNSIRSKLIMLSVVQYLDFAACPEAGHRAIRCTPRVHTPTNAAAGCRSCRMAECGFNIDDRLSNMAKHKRDACARMFDIVVIKRRSVTTLILFETDCKSSFICRSTCPLEHVEQH